MHDLILRLVNENNREGKYVIFYFITERYLSVSFCFDWAYWNMMIIDSEYTIS